MLSRSIVVVNKFFTPSAKEYKFYSGNDFWDYMKKGHNEGMELKSDLQNTRDYQNHIDYMNRDEASNGMWANTASGKWEPMTNGTNIWSMVISFDALYSDAHGIRSGEETKPLIEKTIGAWLVNQGFDPNNIQYAASHHSNTENEHVHIIFGQKEGRMRIKGNLSMRSNKAWMTTMDSYINKRIFNWDPIMAQRQKARKVIANEIIKDNVSSANAIAEIGKIISKSPKQRTSFNSLSKSLKSQFNHVYTKWVNENSLVKKEVASLKGLYKTELQKYEGKREVSKEIRAHFSIREKELHDSLKNALISSSKTNNFIVPPKVLGRSRKGNDISSNKRAWQKKRAKSHTSFFRGFNHNISTVNSQAQKHFNNDMRQIEKRIDNEIKREYTDN